jgi:hypothetical protein
MFGNELLRDEAGQVAVGEGEDKELVRASDIGDKVVIVGDKERVLDDAVDQHVLTKCETLDLGRDLGAGNSVGVEGFDQIEDQALADRGVLRSIAGEIGDVGGTGEVDLEDLFFHCRAAVAKALAVALIDQELMVVDRDDVADPRSGDQQVSVFVRRTGGDVDRHDAQQVFRILLQFGLHDADKGLAVRGDGEALHALVRYPPAGVAADFDSAL